MGKMADFVCDKEYPELDSPLSAAESSMRRIWHRYREPSEFATERQIRIATYGKNREFWAAPFHPESLFHDIDTVMSPPTALQAAGS